MKLNLENLNAGVKFLFDEKNPAEGSVTLRMPTTPERRAMDKATTVKEISFTNGVRYVDTAIDQEKKDRMFWETIIVEWDGHVDAKGKAIPCTKDMKIQLMEQCPKFAAKVNKAFVKLAEMAEAEEAAAEEAAKN